MMAARKILVISDSLRDLPPAVAALDDPEVARRFVTPRPGDLMRVAFPVPAMHCASCLWLLEQLWRFNPGVVRSEANLMNRTVAVEFRPAEISLRAVAETLASLGYEPVLDKEPAAGVPKVRRGLYLKIGVAGFAFQWRGMRHRCQCSCLSVSRRVCAQNSWGHWGCAPIGGSALELLNE